MKCSIVWHARVYNVPWAAGVMRSGHVGNSLTGHSAKMREGCIDLPNGYPETKLRRALAAFLPRPSEQAPKFTTLPGVEFQSELPADPITRLFFQVKGEHALFHGTYDNPSTADPDRVRIAKREVPRSQWGNITKNPMYDFCHRIREAGQMRKRFVVVPSTHDTTGAATIMRNHGLVAGFRDFHNDRAFAIELKYFQNEHVIEGIEPVSNDIKVEYEWSPRMIRRQLSSYGIVNHIRIFILRTWDGRILDHITAAKEKTGGRGLLVVW